jgi:uncharacterized protein YjgD (DUF1641 family)
MPTPENILIEMELILDRIIKTAEELKKKSKGVFSLEEITPLQKSQNELVDKLSKLDDSFQKAYKGKNEVSPIRDRFEKKLSHFQELNNSFIENLSSSSGTIQFDQSKKSKK